MWYYIKVGKVFMKKVFKNKLYSLQLLVDDDLKKDINRISNDCNRVIASYESVSEFSDDNEDTYLDDNYDFERDREELKNLLEKSFEFDRYFVFMLYLKGEPVGYAIYTQREKTNSFVLEFIHVSKEYTNMGIGSMLLKKSCCILKKDFKADEIMATINKANPRSLAMHNNFITSNDLNLYVNDYGNRVTYHIDLANLKTKNKKENEFEM